MSPSPLPSSSSSSSRAVRRSLTSLFLSCTSRWCRAAYVHTYTHFFFRLPFARAHTRRRADASSRRFPERRPGNFFPLLPRFSTSVHVPHEDIHIRRSAGESHKPGVASPPLFKRQGLVVVVVVTRHRSRRRRRHRRPWRNTCAPIRGVAAWYGTSD